MGWGYAVLRAAVKVEICRGHFVKSPQARCNLLDQEQCFTLAYFLVYFFFNICKKMPWAPNIYLIVFCIFICTLLVLTLLFVVCCLLAIAWFSTDVAWFAVCARVSRANVDCNTGSYISKYLFAISLNNVFSTARCSLWIREQNCTVIHITCHI